MGPRCSPLDAITFGEDCPKQHNEPKFGPFCCSRIALVNQFEEIIGFTKSDFANSRFEKFGEKIVFAVDWLILKRCICVRGVCDR